MSTKKNTAADAAVNSCTPTTVAAIHLTRGMILADGDWLIYRQPAADDRGRMIVDVEKEDGARQRLRLSPRRRVRVTTRHSGA